MSERGRDEEADGISAGTETLASGEYEKESGPKGGSSVPRDPTSQLKLPDEPTLQSEGTLPPHSTGQYTRGGALVGTVDPTAATSTDEGFDQRYSVEEVLGEGGMGTVHAASDRRIGRGVALKVIRGDARTKAELLPRFQREARIQGQLEHPSIVPVYDLGETPDGAAFFTMKRIHGLTLEEIVEGLKGGDADYRRAFTRRRLLSAFSQVCLTVAYAHSRGVIHRDLKPANVILGDYGEVYVIDWGIAKLAVPEREEALSVRLSSLHKPRASHAEVEETVETVPGSLLGTPGYMSPEQVRGLDEIDGRSDVYALGAILFELLALEPLRSGRDVEALLNSTLLGISGRPSARAPERDIPSELDAICQRAVRVARDERYPTARALHEAIEAFLDGDRDVERRTVMATEHLRNARIALAQARSRPESSARERAQAIRELNAAIALNPGDRAALNEMLAIVSESPEQMPAEMAAELAVERRRDHARALRLSAVPYALIVLIVMALLAGGARSPAALGAIGVCALIAGSYRWVAGMRGDPGRATTLVVLAMGAVFVATVSVVFGPLVLVPVAAISTAVVTTSQARADARLRLIIGVVCALAVLAPMGLEVAGLVPATYSFEQGAMTIAPLAMDLHAETALPLLASMAVLALAVPLVMVGRTIDALAAAELRLAAHAWHLRQLLQPGTEGAPSSVPPPSR